MPHQDELNIYQYILLNDIPIAVKGNVDVGIVNMFGKRVGQGDPGPDDHPTASTWIQSDWSSGGQVRHGKPDIIGGRFDFATSETMWAKSITIPQLPTVWTDPTGSGLESWVVGVFQDLLWSSWGVNLRFYNAATNTWDGAFAMAAVPVRKATVYTHQTGGTAGTSYLYIPQGANSQRFDGATFTTLGKSAVDFEVWDEKLFRLGTDGSLEFTTDGTTWIGLTYIPDGTTPRLLTTYITMGGEDALHIVTDKSVWSYDFSSIRMYQTQLRFPRHPDQGLAATPWRGELYVSVGDGVHRYNRQIIAAAGLDRNDGMPEEFAGPIVDMEPEYNAIFALVRGASVGEEIDPTATLELGGGDDPMESGTSTSNNSLLMRWNGFGWHYVDSHFGGSVPTSVVVSDAGNEYSVWYAWDKTINRVLLSRTYFNPANRNDYDVAASSWFETAWYNFGWEGNPKIAKTFEMFVEPRKDGITDIGSVVIYFKTDNETNDWTNIGTITATGEYHFHFGLDDDAPSGSTERSDYHGIEFERIKFRFELTRSSINIKNKPVIKWFTLVARKFMRPQRTWKMLANLSADNDRGLSPDEVEDALLDMVLTPRSFNFTHRGSTTKVDIVSIQGVDAADANRPGRMRNINLIESFEVSD